MCLVKISSGTHKRSSMLCTRTDTPGTPEYQCSFDSTDCPVRDTGRPHLWPGTLGQDGPVCMRNSPATGIEFVYSDGSALPLTCTSGGHGAESL